MQVIFNLIEIYYITKYDNFKNFAVMGKKWKTGKSKFKIQRFLTLTRFLYRLWVRFTAKMAFESTMYPEFK